MWALDVACIWKEFFQALTVRLSPLGRAIHPSLGQQSPTRQSNRNMSCPSPWDQLQSGCLNFEHFMAFRGKLPLHWWKVVITKGFFLWAISSWIWFLPQRLTKLFSAMTLGTSLTCLHSVLAFLLITKVWIFSFRLWGLFSSLPYWSAGWKTGPGALGMEEGESICFLGLP